MRDGGASGLQPTHGAVVDHLQVHLVSHQLPDVVDAVFDHGGPAGQRRSCCIYESKALRQTNRSLTLYWQKHRLQPPTVYTIMSI